MSRYWLTPILDENEDMNYDNWLDEPLRRQENEERYEDIIDNIMEEYNCDYVEAVKHFEDAKTEAMIAKRGLYYE